jgi:hypothetical protein
MPATYANFACRAMTVWIKDVPRISKSGGQKEKQRRGPVGNLKLAFDPAAGYSGKSSLTGG